MARNDELTSIYNNAAALLDCIDTIIKYKSYLNKNEVELEDPEETARLILRRILKAKFNGFNIRKNLYDYALRCDDRNMYVTLYAAAMLARNNHFIDRLSKPIQDKLKSVKAAGDLLRNMQGLRGIQCEFREDGKLFIHVNFQPLLGNRTYARATFDEYCMAGRIQFIETTMDTVSKLEFDPIYESLITLIEENSIYHIYSNSILDEIDEKFIEFYFSKAPGDRTGKLREISIEYMKAKRAKEDAALLKQMEEEEIILSVRAKEREDAIRQPAPEITLTPTETVRPEPVLVEVTRPTEIADPVATPIDLTEFVVPDPVLVEAEPVRVAAEPALDFGDWVRVLDEIHPAPEDPEFRLTQIDEAPVAEDIVLRDTEAEPEVVVLREVEREAPRDVIRLTRRIGDFELEIPENAILEDPDLDAGFRRVGGADLALYTLYANHGFENPGLDTTSIDVYDDVDVDKDGIYFSIVEGNLIYLVYKDSEELIRTEDVAEAAAAFESTFGRSVEAIRYTLLKDSDEFIAAPIEYDEDVDEDDDEDDHEDEEEIW